MPGRVLGVVVGLGLALPLLAQEPKLTATNGSSGDEFGASVGLHGDVAVVGARFAGTPGNEPGAAYVFVRSGGTWAQQDQLTAGDGEDGDGFGTAVAVSGDVAVVGAPRDDEGGEDAGAVYVFVRQGSTWTKQAKLLADDAEPTDFFGVAVALSGDYLLVGAPRDDEGGEDAGAAYVFFWDGQAWAQQAKLTTGDPVNGDTFGNAVALDGAYAVIGAVGDNFPDAKSGSAYVFVRDGQAWEEQDKIFAPDGTEENYFGNAVAIRGDHILVGMSRDDDEDTDAGSAYVFVRNGDQWARQVKLLASDAAMGDELGHAVALSGAYAVVTARRDDEAADDAGAAYLFKYDASTATWGQGCTTLGTTRLCTESARLTAEDASAGDEYGHAVALDGITTIVTASSDDGRGSAYTYELAAPAAPQLTAPADRASGVSANVELRWQAVAGATAYWVQVATSSSFVTTVVDAPTLTAPRYQASALADNTTHFWRVAASNAVGPGAWSVVRRFTVGTGTAVEQVDDEVPAGYQLDQNYPNPFNPTTTLSFALPEAAHVQLTVYDTAGLAVTTLVDEPLAAGRYTATWAAAGRASGVYVVRMQAGGEVQTRKMILVK